VWRDERPEDDDAVLSLCLALNREDPGPEPVGPDQIRRTLHELRNEPTRGKAVVLDVDGRVCGYALLISFWSNELGGEVCTIDELYVAPDARGQGRGRALVERVREMWARPIVATALETSPANDRALAFYRRLGFTGSNTALVRRHSMPHEQRT
jgi:ribosomal protein S18 acetylase RimI-like enzyme